MVNDILLGENNDAVEQGELVVPVATASPPERVEHNFLSRFTRRHLRAILGVVLLLVVGLGMLFLTRDPLSIGRYAAEEIVGLVADKISQSAPIRIYLPDGVSLASARAALAFEPKIKGRWEEPGEEEDAKEDLRFIPNEPLTLASYYAVTLETDSGTIRDDFLADIDPVVLAVFPNANTESNEYAKITIVFSRPMVPLTTLDELEKREIPITISPETEGRFKWVTTRNLQFIPEERLVRSSEYTVEVGSGLVSMDGLEVPAFSHAFKTRPLRRNHIHSGKTIYNNPIRITFNQPVDLERTVKEITLRDTTDDHDTGFIAEYAIREVLDPESDEMVRAIDRSIINIFHEVDRHGREKIWDFEHTYALSISRTFPLEGDIILDEVTSTNIEVTRFIDAITAESERSTHVDQWFFDPQGKLWVHFYEDIDKEKSVITADPLIESGYGEKCRPLPEGEKISYRDRDTCEKEEDKTRLFFVFDENQLGLGETFSLTFEQVINMDGLMLNTEPVVETVKTFPRFEIIGSTPADATTSASLTDLSLCTSTPAIRPGASWGEMLSMNLEAEEKYWSRSRRVRPSDRDKPCDDWRFYTRVTYGLLPHSDYEMTLRLEDEFSQKVNTAFSFTTGPVPDNSLNFFHYQDRYTVTTPEKLKLTYATVNMEYVNLHICKVDPVRMLRYLDDKPSYREGPEILDCIGTQTHRIDLVPVKYWVRNFVQVQLGDYLPDPLGHYVLTFSHPDYRTSWDDQLVYERTYLSVTNLAVVQKHVERSGPFSAPDDNIPASLLDQVQNLYWVTQIGTLEPIFGARVDVYTEELAEGRETEIIKTESATTDSTGVARTPPVWNGRGAVISAGADSALITDDYTLRFAWASDARASNRAYVYTDRPIYKPGDTVSIKGIFRIGYDGTYEIYRDTPAHVTLHNSRNEIIGEKDVPYSEFGTFTVDFPLPQDTPLGTYTVSTSGGSARFDVEDYTPSPFKVEVATNQDEYIAGDTAEITMSGEYYFGVPLEGGTVEYGISSQSYFFDRYQDDNFNFGNPWYWCWYECTFEDEFVLRGEAQLDANGKATLVQDLDFDVLFGEDEDVKSKIFVLYVTMINPNGQSVSTQQSFIVHRGEFYLGLKVDRSFLPIGKDTTIRVKSVDVDGQEYLAGGLTLRVHKNVWKSYRRQEVDGGYYNRWVREQELVREERFATDKNGDWSLPLTLSDSGSYELLVTGSDNRGNPISVSTWMYVYGSGSASVRPRNDTTLDLVAESTRVEVGEQARMIINSPYERAKALVAIERGQVFSYEIIDIDQNIYAYEFTVEDIHVPNVFASVLLISPDPEVRFGVVDFDVATDTKSIDVVISTDKSVYLPGEAVELSVTARDHTGAPVEAELSIAVVDLSVLALKGNPKKNPLVFFYNGFPLAVSTSSNLKNLLFELDVPNASKGGGGVDPEDLARRKRGIFKDTAFWTGSLETDADGNATVQFTLPHNLTTWQVESLAITKDTRLGVGYSEFTSRKELMLVPLAPRFIVPGDVFTIGAKIFNQTQEQQRLTITIGDTELDIDGQRERSVTIGPDQTETIYFSVMAPVSVEKGSHRFTLFGGNADVEDTVEQTISITRNNTYETVATSAATKGDSVTEYVYFPSDIIKDRGGLTIESNATLAIFLSDALAYMAEYPYGCSEQIASKLAGIGILKRGLAIENVGEDFAFDKIEFEGQYYSVDEVVEIGLNRIYANHTVNSGFSYYPGMKTSPYLTLHVVNAMEDLRLAGYDIRQDILEDAARYLSEGARRQFRYTNRSFDILALYTLGRLETVDIPTLTLDSEVIGYANDAKYINEQIGGMVLAHLAMVLADDRFDAAERNIVYSALKNRIAIDGRGAHLAPLPNGRLWEYYETPIKNTALLVKVFATYEDDHPMLEKALKWLFLSRDKDGAWGSTNNTLSVIDAFVTFLNWQEETKADYLLDLTVGGEPKAQFDISASTVLESVSHFIPTAEFGTETLIPITLTKTRRSGPETNLYYDMIFKYFLPVESIAPRDEGISVERTAYRLDDVDSLEPIHEASVGDVFRMHLRIGIPDYRNFVSVEDYIPAGVQIVNFNLATEDQRIKRSLSEPDGALRFFRGNGRTFAWGFPTWLRAAIFSEPDVPDLIYEESPRADIDRIFVPDAEESHRDRLFLFKESMTPGVYEYDYFVRALIPGTYQHLPAIVTQMYFPEIFGRTGGSLFTVTE